MQIEASHIAVVLLMAGQSRRMGQEKLALPWKGTSLGRHSLDVLAEAFPHSYKVAVERPDMVDKNYPFVHGFVSVVNPHPRDGQASSLRLGLGQVVKEYSREDSERGLLQGVLCAVADQPFLDVDTLQALMEAFQEAVAIDRKAIVVPVYEPPQTRGNPVLFSSYWVERLALLEGDQGGRAILQGPGADHIVEVQIDAIDGLSKGLDVDTPEAYKVLQAYANGVK